MVSFWKELLSLENMCEHTERDACWCCRSTKWKHSVGMRFILWCEIYYFETAVIKKTVVPRRRRTLYNLALYDNLMHITYVTASHSPCVRSGAWMQNLWFESPQISCSQNMVSFPQGDDDEKNGATCQACKKRMIYIKRLLLLLECVQQTPSKAPPVIHQNLFLFSLHDNNEACKIRAARGNNSKCTFF